ncbi:MAG: hypothetical protein WAR79_01265 [Melioribacteraceae bacterium]
MQTLFGILVLFSILFLIIGLIKPDVILRWETKKTRLKIVLYFGASFIIFLILNQAFKKSTSIEITKEAIAISINHQNEFQKQRSNFYEDYKKAGEYDGIFNKTSEYTKKFMSDSGFKINNWVGYISNISSDKTELEIESNYLEFKLIYKCDGSVSSYIKSKFDSLNVGDNIIFSGKVFEDELKGIEEGSITHDGSMRSPEFVIEFTDIRKNSFPELYTDQAKKNQNEFEAIQEKYRKKINEQISQEVLPSIDERSESLKIQNEFQKQRWLFWTKFDSSRNSGSVYMQTANYTRDFMQKNNFKLINWVGKIFNIDKNERGKKLTLISNYLDFKIKYINKEFVNEIINNKLDSLQVGSQVVFMGKVFVDEEKGINEGSITKKGSMELPEFIVEFSNIFIDANPELHDNIERTNRNEFEAKQKLENKELEAKLTKERKEKEKNILKNPVEYLSKELKKSLGEEDFISCKISNSNITINWVIGSSIRSLNYDIFRILDLVINSPIKYKKITLLGDGNVIDPFGHEKIINLAHLIYNRNTINNINWENALMLDLWALADYRVFHPAFEKEL